MARAADASPRTPRRRARWTAAASAAAVFLAVSEAGAEPGRAASLSWVRLPGAESCVGARALAEAVERRMGRAALVPTSRAEVSIEGRIEAAQASPRWRVELVVADASGADLGSRRLSSDAADCRALDAEVALTVALLVDPDAALQGATAGAGPTGGPPGATGTLPPAGASAPTGTLPPAGPPGATGALGPTGTLPPAGPSGATGTLGPTGPLAPTGMLPAGRGEAPATSASPGAAAAPGWGIALVVGPAFSIGLLPSVSGGAQLRAIVTPPRFWPFQLGGTVWAPSQAGSGDATASFFLATGSISACPLRLSSGGWRGLACAGVEVGELRAGGFGLSRDRAYSEPAVLAAIEGRVLRRLWGPLTATAGLGLQIPFVRARFYYVDAGGEAREVFLASAVAGAASLSIGVDL